ncbi:MAG TPA: M48 family metallopeptidase, partial [Clostridia bacterium]|nr:M48 family metallopeptidase [Clostridia bacterium]
AAAFESGVFYLPAENEKLAAAAWYKAHARDLIPERVAAIAEKIGINYGNIKINGASTRWGSCSARGT